MAVLVTAIQSRVRQRVPSTASRPGAAPGEGPEPPPSCSSPPTVYSCPSCPSLHAWRFPIPDTH